MSLGEDKTSPTLFLGLANIVLSQDRFDLAPGISLSRTYAHLMAPFIMAFQPAPPGEPHPAPWKAASGGLGFDVVAELKVAHESADYAELLRTAKTILFLMRLWLDPEVTAPVVSSHPFNLLLLVPDTEARITPFEIYPRHFALSTPDGTFSPAAAAWISRAFPVAHRLMKQSPEFSLAADAISSGQFVNNPTLTMVSLWAALEALFVRSPAELRFRVSALIASFLKPPGQERVALQRTAAKLYDMRSAAAHGRPKHGDQDLLATFTLVKEVLLKIIALGAVPSEDQLNQLLFASPES